MVCPACGYALSAFDKECPRCKNLTKQKVAEQEISLDSVFPDPASVQPQPAPQAPRHVPLPVHGSFAPPPQKMSATKIVAIVLTVFFISSLLGTIFLSVLGNQLKAPPEITFARNTFSSLARGDSNVESMIDFETLQLPGTDVGAMYASMPDEANKAAFRKSFITGFSSSFQQTGASADAIQNWRIESSDSARTVVVGNGAKGKILITVTKRNGEQKMSGIDFSP